MGDLSKVEYRQLGKSGLRVSVPILGAMSIGDSRWQKWVLDEEEALPLLKAAYDRGLNTWDTANVYSNGESERIIGRAMKQYNIPRRKLVICTKCCGTTRESNDPKVLALKEIDKTVDYVNQRGLSRQGIFNAVDASLERLQTDYIDLYQIHRFDKTVPIDETMKALHDLVQSGKVRYIGASSMFAYQFATMQFVAEKNGWTKFVSMQNHYSLLYREEEREPNTVLIQQSKVVFFSFNSTQPSSKEVLTAATEMNKLCLETGVGLIPWSPLAMGNLARPHHDAGTTTRSSDTAPLSTTDIEIIGRVEELAKRKNWTMSHVALSWAMSKGITSPIIGFSKVERIDETLEIQGKELSSEEIITLEEPYKPKNIVGHS